MHRFLTIISSLSLVAYCVFSLYLPSIIKESTSVPVDYSILEEVEANLDSSDEETLRQLTKMMINNLRSDQNNRNEVLDSTIEVYLTYDYILIWLLLIHLVLVSGFLSKSKPNKSLKARKLASDN